MISESPTTLRVSSLSEYFGRCEHAQCKTKNVYTETRMARFLTSKAKFQRVQITYEIISVYVQLNFCKDWNRDTCTFLEVFGNIVVRRPISDSYSSHQHELASYASNLADSFLHVYQIRFKNIKKICHEENSRHQQSIWDLVDRLLFD